MRALVTTLGVVLTLGIAVGGLPAESGAAQATLGCPATAQAGQQFTIEVAIDVGTTPLGAYSIAVTYDPAVLTLASVEGGNTAEFSGRPTTNTPTPGTTNLSAFQSVSLTSPQRTGAGVAIVVLSKVTAPFRANALPSSVAPVASVIDVRASPSPPSLDSPRDPR